MLRTLSRGQKNRLDEPRLPGEILPTSTRGGLATIFHRGEKLQYLVDVMALTYRANCHFSKSRFSMQIKQEELVVLVLAK